MTTETMVHIRQNQCFVRLPKGKKQSNKHVLTPGMRLSITPMLGFWIEGEYLYDEQTQEHAWRYDETHFVGLVDGMRVRIDTDLFKEQVNA